jgi:hypothetical protein
MAQLSLKNVSGKTLPIGQMIKLAPNSNNSFVIAQLGDYGVIGTTAQSSVSGNFCLVNLINTVQWNDVIGKPTTFATTGGTDTGNSYFPSGW